MRLRPSILCLMLVLALGSLLSACATRTGDGPSATEATPAYPAPAAGGPLSTAASSASSSEPLAWESQPASGRANVRGYIELTSSTVLLGELFLAAAIPTGTPGVDILELDTEVTPAAQIDRETGQFLFRDIEPGRYGIIAWEPMSSAALPDPDTGDTLMFDVAGGQILDVGTLYYP